MNTISLISGIAVVVSIGGVFPQIVAMFQARSSAGQSALGWCLGVLVNGLLGYVNVVGSQSAVLAAGNAVGLILSAMALALVYRYRVDAAAERFARFDAGAAVSTLIDSTRAPLIDLETDQLEALQGAVSHARASRESVRDRRGGEQRVSPRRRPQRNSAQGSQPARR